jgi:hypothetical protein
MDTMEESGVIRIEKQYYLDFFEKLYKFKKDILVIPDNVREAFNAQRENLLCMAELKDIYSKYHPMLIFQYLAYIVRIFISNIRLLFLPKFDANKYLVLFDLVKLDKGYVLDYDYCGDHPYVYTRKDNIISKLFHVNNILDDLNKKKYLKNIYFEKSPKGFFQYAVFLEIVNQFYLYWHALFDNYYFIYSKKQIEDTLRDILEEQLKSEMYT